MPWVASFDKVDQTQAKATIESISEIAGCARPNGADLLRTKCRGMR